MHVLPHASDPDRPHPRDARHRRTGRCAGSGAGPVGVSVYKETASPSITDATPIEAATIAICSGERDSCWAVAAGSISRDTIRSRSNKF